MGAGGVTSRITERIDGRYGDLPVRDADENARYDLYVDDEKVQSRWYDDEGKVVRNRDYYHQDPKGDHSFPHDHNWDWNDGKPYRNPTNLKPDYDTYF